MQLFNKLSVEQKIHGLQTPRDLRSGLVGERKYRIDMCLTERSVFIVSLEYIQIYKGISLRSRRGKKERALRGR